MTNEQLEEQLEILLDAVDDYIEAQECRNFDDRRDAFYKLEDVYKEVKKAVG